MRKIAVIINANAGSIFGQDMTATVTAAFERHAVKARVIAATGKRLRETARGLLDEGFNILVAGGGDGTVSAVASEVAGSDAALGVLPLGTLNHFARDLHIPLDLDGAVDLICSGTPKAVDIGAVNDHLFINNCSMGVYPDQVRVRQKWQKRVGRIPAIVIASLYVLYRFPYLPARLEFNGTRLRRRSPMLLVSNNRYLLDPADLTGREALDRGELGVYIIRNEGRMGLIRVALHCLVYRLEELDSFESYTATDLLLKARRRRVRVAVDGEVLRLRSPLRFQILPGGLQVIAPGD
jgi:diacylglycerol kinase family enzyme